jgi:hypothetical protein
LAEARHQIVGICREVERLQDSRSQALWILDRRQGDKPDAIREMPERLRRRFAGQPRLAHAADAQNRQQAHIWIGQPLTDLKEIFLAADKSSGLDRKVVRGQRSFRIHSPFWLWFFWSSHGSASAIRRPELIGPDLLP